MLDIGESMKKTLCQWLNEAIRSRHSRSIFISFEEKEKKRENEQRDQMRHLIIKINYFQQTHQPLKQR